MKQALTSQIVNEGRIAYGLEKKFIKAKQQKLNIRLKKQCFDSTFRIIQPRNTEVANGKSALLQVLCMSNRTVHYQWRKDGESLSNGANYSGVHDPILLVRSVGQESQGNYSCYVWDGDDSKCSDDVCLSVYYPPLSKEFCTVYANQGEIPEDSWPPVAATAFINLALIMKGKFITDEYDYAVQGDMDDIIETKEKIEYEEVFGKYESGSLVLVEGRPGSGKTTLVHKVAKDWAMNRSILVGAKLVILVPLRLLSSSIGDTRLHDILKLYLLKKKIKKVKNHIEECMGKGVCFIIDGLDEFQSRNDKGNSVYKLLRKRILPNAMVIVASRPVGVVNLRRHSSKRVEVLGFSRKNIFEYIKKYPFMNPLDSLRIETYLSSHRNVLHMCYLPVHMAMICYVYSLMGNNIPQTETKIYEYFTLLTITRKLKCEDDGVKPFKSLKELSGEIKECFDNICKLAFEMATDSKQVVHQGETTVTLSETSGSDAPSLGLVTIDCTAKLFNIEDFYTYLHLTFQEYLAAVYIAGLEDNDQLKLIQRYKNKSEFIMIWRFFFGTVNFTDKSNYVNELLGSTIMDTMNKVLCGFESQQHAVSDHILKSNTCLYFKDNIFTASDFLAMGYIISSSQNVLSSLVFDECKLDEEGVTVLTEQLSLDHLKNLKYLGYHKKSCTVPQFKILNQLLRKLPLLEILNAQNWELMESLSLLVILNRQIFIF